jgi:hypothetical protein
MRWLAAPLALLAALANGEPLLFVEAEVAPAAPRVQAQAVYTLRFFQGADVRQVSLSGPQARLADIRPLGVASTHERVRAGRRYRVHEQRFAVLPHASGELELAGAAAEASRPGAGRQRWPAPSLRLTVRPLPAGAAAATWLPAESLRVEEEWSAPAGPGGGQLRTLRIEAVGVDARQLPEIGFAVPGATVVAEPPHLETRVAGDRLLARREQRYRLTPTGSAPVQVPPLSLPWWETGSDQGAVATLPGRSLAGAAAAPNAAKAPNTAWPAVLAALAGVAVLVRALRRHRLWQVRSAKHPADLARALLAWAAHRWPQQPPTSLPELAGRLRHPDNAAAVFALDRRIYGPGRGSDRMIGWRALLRE